MAQTFLRNGRNMTLGEVRKWRAEQDKLKVQLKESDSKTVEKVKADSVVETNTSKELHDEPNELEILLKEYLEKFNKKPAGRYAKDTEWLKEKLNSSK